MFTEILAIIILVVMLALYLGAGWGLGSAIDTNDEYSHSAKMVLGTGLISGGLVLLLAVISGVIYAFQMIHTYLVGVL